MQKLRMPESKTFVAASSNSACDAVVLNFATSDLMVVRAHALSLERETLMQPYFKAKRKRKVAEVESLSEGYERQGSTQAVLEKPTVEVEESQSTPGPNTLPSFLHAFTTSA